MHFLHAFFYKIICDGDLIAFLFLSAFSAAAFCIQNRYLFIFKVIDC
jgi:hypothetical protein